MTRTGRSATLATAAIVVVGIAVLWTLLYHRASDSQPNKVNTGGPPESSTPAKTTNSTATSGTPGASSQLQQMEVAQAVMVTVELDFGPRIPSMAEALRDIERGYKPDDGAGRTFAILDAYGESTSDGKLHISMHVSSEKPGIGSLTFKRTGEILWNSRIVPSTHAAASQGKNLLISLSDNLGTSRLLDGSGGINSIMDAKVKELGIPVRQYWPDGSDREVTFVYSACGCPVKVMARRIGERTVRTKDLPVIFPDDPAVVASITRLMAW